jgi:hypothetical protein
LAKLASRLPDGCKTVTNMINACARPTAEDFRKKFNIVNDLPEKEEEKKKGKKQELNARENSASMYVDHISV